MEEEQLFNTTKHVDESWKEQVSKEKGEAPEVHERAELSFSTFITSLGIQAFVQMGEIKPPGSEKIEVDLDTARETIDLLLMLKKKTKGNLSQEEDRLLSSLIADLQLKFVEHKMS